MAIQVNTIGVAHARRLIRRGNIESSASWSFSAKDGNRLLGPNGDNWGEYARWFLAIDTSAAPKTKARYKFPFGKNGKVYRRGIIAAKSRAAQQGYPTIENVASQLLEEIDRKMKAKRKLKKVDVHFISLVNKGANKKHIIWKSENPPEDAPYSKTVGILKTDEEKRMVYGIVYAPDEVDSQGDVATAEVIEKMAYDFMRNARTTQVDKQHDYQPDEGFVAESWIVKEGDPLFDEVGAWAVGIKVENDATWEAIKKGEITGISLAGEAEVEEIAKNDENLLQKIWEAVRGLTSRSLEKDFNAKMKKIDIWKVLDAFHSAVMEIYKEDFKGDRKQALLNTIDQMREYVDKNVEKAAPVLTTNQLESLKKAIPVLEQIVSIHKSEELGMEKQAIQEMLQDALEKALQPVLDEIDALKAQNEELKKGFEERIEKLEKASKGRQTMEGQTDNVKKEDEFIWV